MKILLVEDNTQFRHSVKELLHNRFPSYEIVEAGDGKEAMEKVAGFCPDLIFMDIRLPGESGLRVTRIIKEKCPNIHIIILTSYDLPEYREIALQSGASFFLTKSSTSESIISLVENLLNGQEEKRGP